MALEGVCTRRGRVAAATASRMTRVRLVAIGAIGVSRGCRLLEFGLPLVTTRANPRIELRSSVRIVARLALVSLGQCPIGLLLMTLGADLRRLVGMAFVTRLAALVRTRTPSIRRSDLNAMTCHASWPPVGLLVRRVATAAFGVMTTSAANVRMTGRAGNRLAPGGTVLRVTLGAAVAMRAQLIRLVTVTADLHGCAKAVRLVARTTYLMRGRHGSPDRFGNLAVTHRTTPGRLWRCVCGVAGAAGPVLLHLRIGQLGKDRLVALGASLR